MPELNEYGREYQAKGLREQSAGETAATGEAPQGTTVQELGSPLMLNWANYLTVMGHHFFTAEKGTRARFEGGDIDLWVGGPIDPRWTGLVNPVFNIDDGGVDVELGYGQYVIPCSRVLSSIRFGQTLPFAIFFNQGGPTLTLSTPLVLSTPGDTGTTWTPTTLVRGLEVGGVGSRWNAYFGVGQPHLEAGSPGSSDFHNDLYASGEYLFTPKGDALTVYGYWGETFLPPTDSEQGFHRIGVFGNAYFSKTKAVIGYVTGEDKNSDGVGLDNSGYFLLGEYLLTDRWAPYVRYDWFKRDLSAGGSETTEGPTAGVSWWAASQIRLTLETQFLKTSGQSRDSLVTTELLWAF